MFNIFQKFKKEASRPFLLSDAIDKSAIKIGQITPKPVRQIVDGKLYDTSKAECVAHCLMPEWIADRMNLIVRESFAVCNVYRTEKGNFFAVYGCHIAAISEDEAKSLLSETVDEYMEIFGEVEEA